MDFLLILYCFLYTKRAMFLAIAKRLGISKSVFQCRGQIAQDNEWGCILESVSSQAKPTHHHHVADV